MKAYAIVFHDDFAMLFRLPGFDGDVDGGVAALHTVLDGILHDGLQGQRRDAEIGKRCVELDQQLVLEPGLFDGRACIFCDTEESAPRAVRRIGELYDVLNMRPLYMRAAQHDVHTAYVSHISHVTSFALALTVLDKEKDEKHIFDLASGGFSSTVRLAKSNADMWVPILTQNRDNVLHVMDTYIDKMQQFRQAVADDDEARIRELIYEANRIKKILR